MQRDAPGSAKNRLVCTAAWVKSMTALLSGHSTSRRNFGPLRSVTFLRGPWRRLRTDVGDRSRVIHGHNRKLQVDACGAVNAHGDTRDFGVTELGMKFTSTPL